ncbi:MAG: DAK2 domain-containing protein [Bacillota bacterium]
MQADKMSQKYIKNINGQDLKKCFISGLNLLKEKKELIDSLNVFPVPDGDTGTNMYLTFLEGIKKLKSTTSNRVDKITSSLSQGALMGARGNSGVILSQLLRGFSEVNQNQKYMTAENLAKSLKKASEIAYHGVMKPVEGTILTVSRGAARGANKALEESDDIVLVLQKAVEEAQKTLNETPEKLPQLKEAGVVDAGGKGYFLILKGILNGLTSEENIDLKSSKSQILEVEQRNIKTTEEIEYVYDTQILLDLKNENEKKDIDTIRNDLQNYGDSLIVVGSDNTLKIHIHSNHPGIVLEYTLKLGNLIDVSIENMEIQNQEYVNKKDKQEQTEELDDFSNGDTENLTDSNFSIENTDEGGTRGIISVVQGDGLKEIFQKLGINKIIDGGQSMNPSTNNFLEAIKEIDKKEIIIFPNNSNIISAANQAASMTDKKVIVIPTNSIAENISALMANNPQKDLSKLKEEMKSEIEQVKTLKFTKAVKDSSINGMKIKKGDYLGLYEDDITVRGEDLLQVVINLFDEVWDGEDLITIYSGKDLKEEIVEDIIDKLKDKFKVEEIENYFGGQNTYPLIISLE